MGRGNDPTLAEGQIAPDTSFTTMEGGTVRLSGLLQDGPVVLAFYKASCPTCQLTLPYLDRLQGGPFRVIPVSQDGAETARAFSREYGIASETLLDTAETGYTASNSFGLTHVPTMFLVEGDRRIGWVSIGFYKSELLELADRAGLTIFSGSDVVPEMKGG